MTAYLGGRAECRIQRCPWIDRSTSGGFRIRLTAQTGRAGVARVRTYQNILKDPWRHPVATSAGPDVPLWDRRSIGRIRRRQVRTEPERRLNVGEEANRLREVEARLGHDPDPVYTEYVDPGRDPWWTLVLSVLHEMPSKALAQEVGLSTRSIREIRNRYLVSRALRRWTVSRHARDHPHDGLARLTR